MNATMQILSTEALADVHAGSKITDFATYVSWAFGAATAFYHGMSTLAAYAGTEATLTALNGGNLGA